MHESHQRASMMNANQYQQNAYFQNASPYPKPYPPPQQPQNQSIVPNGHWPPQIPTVQATGKKPQYPGHSLEQSPQSNYPNQSAYQHPNAQYYSQRPMHSPNLQQYQATNASPQSGRQFPTQHPNQRFNNSYPNSAYRNEQEAKNSYPYPQPNSYDSTRPTMPYNQQNNAYNVPPANMSYPQRQYIEPRPYGNSLNSEANRMRYPVNYNANFNNQARLPISNVPVSPMSMALHRSTASQNFIPMRPQSPSLPSSPSVNESALMKKESNDKHLRQALSSMYPGVKENKIEMIESVKPVFKRSRPLTNIGNVDHRKILMSLKSGLLAETTWAFDCLNILSNNGSLKLASTPSLLSNLMDYYKCFLNLIFDDLFADTENDYQLKMIRNDYFTEREEFDRLIQNGEKVFLLDSTNYTFKSRLNGLPVQVKTEPDLDSAGLKIANDLSNFEETCDYSYIQDGNGLPTAHIISTLDSFEELRSFIKDSQVFEDSKLSSDSSKKCKRKLEFDSEAELLKSNPTLCPRRESLESLLKRCHVISTIIRNLSFLPENAQLMAHNSALLLVLARLLSFNHLHYEKKTFAIILYNSENKTQEKENMEAAEIFSEFPLETLHMIRLNTCVTLSNMSEYLDLAEYSDKIILPLLDSLLHWAVCQSSYAKDTHPPDALSFQLLVLEILVKLSMKISNIDLILATPPFSRLEEFYQILVRSIGKEEDQVLRELSLVILSNFAKADLLSARIILHLDYSIFNLLTFIEQSEFTKRTQLYNRHYISGIEPFTITYMLIHAANTLRTLAAECDRKDLHLIKKHEDRIVDLIMSQILEPEVTNILADLIFILSNDKSK